MTVSIEHITAPNRVHREQARSALKNRKNDHKLAIREVDVSENRSIHVSTLLPWRHDRRGISWQGAVSGDEVWNNLEEIGNYIVSIRLYGEIFEIA